MAKTLSGSFGGGNTGLPKTNVYSDGSTKVVSAGSTKTTTPSSSTGKTSGGSSGGGSSSSKVDASVLAPFITPGKETQAESILNKSGYSLNSAVTTSDTTRNEDTKLGANIKSLKAPGSADGSMSDVSSSPYLKTINDYINNLDARLKSTVDNLNSSYDATKKATEVKQAGEAGSTQAGVLRIGGYLGESGSGTGVMLTLAGKHRDELTNLQSQRDKAILDAQNAYEDKNFEAAKTYYQASKDIEQTMYNRQQDFFNNTIKATEFSNSLRKPIDDLASTAIANGASGEIVQQIQNAQTLADAVNAAGDFAIAATGIVGEYYAYKRDAIANGLTPVDFNTYQNIDANRKAKIAAAGNATGLDNATTIRVQAIASQFDGEQIVKDYNAIAQSIDAVRNAGDTPTDDIQRVYAFAKIMDPNSVVREGEYKTIQDYSQALIEKTGKKFVRVFDNKGFLTEEARKYITDTLENRFKSTEKAYSNLSSEYGRRIDKITGKTDGMDYITNYSKPFSVNDEIKAKDAEAKKSVDDFIIKNPLKAETISSLYNVPNTSDQDVWEYIQANFSNLIKTK